MPREPRGAAQAERQRGDAIRVSRPAARVAGDGFPGGHIEEALTARPPPSWDGRRRRPWPLLRCYCRWFGVTTGVDLFMDGGVG
jgi:hypothetical protein